MADLSDNLRIILNVEQFLKRVNFVKSAWFKSYSKFL